MFPTLKTNTKEEITDHSRVVMHIDFDSFFASVEQQANPFLRGRPIGVGGSSLSKGIVCAASIEAKKYGVKTAMPMFKAVKLCPNILGIKGDGTKYSWIQKKTIKLFSEYTDLVEPFSIDESFIDVTKTLKFFDSPENIANEIKNKMRRLFGEYITCSVGVGPNKLVAKLVSDLRKPNGLFIVTEENLNSVLQSVELKDFCGIGNRIEKRLNKLNIYTTKQLQEADHEKLYKEFGNVGSRFLINLAFGKDYDPVSHVEDIRTPKSIGHQHTLSKNTRDVEIMKVNVRRLSEMVGRRLRRKEMKGKIITLYLRDSEFHSQHESKNIGKYIDSGRDIYEIAEQIFERIYKGQEIRLVSVSISHLIPKDKQPLHLFLEEQKLDKITSAADLINDKFGEFTLVPADTLRADRTKGKISSFLKH